MGQLSQTCVLTERDDMEVDLSKSILDRFGLKRVVVRHQTTRKSFNRREQHSSHANLRHDEVRDGEERGNAAEGEVGLELDWVEHGG